MNVKAYENYVYYDARNSAKYDALSPAPMGIQAAKLAEYTAYVETDHLLAPGKELAPTPELLQVTQTARRFVEVLTGESVTCDIRIFTELYKDVLAHYSPQFDTVAVRDTEQSMYARNLYGFGRLLVHEMMHSTARDYIQFADIETSEGRNIVTLSPHQVEPEITQGTTTESFFEEALAEQAASRWQEYVNPAISNQDRTLKQNDEGITLPLRTYISLQSDESYIPAAYATFGVQLLSDYLGVNLFKQLLDTRKKDGREQAAVQLKQLVNSVEPGLYELLLSANYTRQDFKDCLEIIKQAIANHAHEQYTQAA